MRRDLALSLTRRSSICPVKIPIFVVRRIPRVTRATPQLRVLCHNSQSPQLIELAGRFPGAHTAGREGEIHEDT